MMRKTLFKEGRPTHVVSEDHKKAILSFTSKNEGQDETSRNEGGMVKIAGGSKGSVLVLIQSSE